MTTHPLAAPGGPAALLTTQAYFTAAGSAYHVVPACRALTSGRILADWDCAEYPCDHGHPLESAPLPAALEQGKWPCPVCVPAALRAFPPLYVTYGHRPIPGFSDGRGLAHVCARCHQPGAYAGTAPLRWPCTTATILGLHIRRGITPARLSAFTTSPEGQSHAHQ